MYDGVDDKDGQSDKEPEPPKPKKKKPKSMISLDSYIRKKDKKDVNLPDYDQTAKEEMADEGLLFSVNGGVGSLAGVKYSDSHLYEPEQADLDFKENSLNDGVNPLSYKQVKRWQYKMHPRDR